MNRVSNLERGTNIASPKLFSMARGTEDERYPGILVGSILRWPNVPDRRGRRVRRADPDTPRLSKFSRSRQDPVSLSRFDLRGVRPNGKNSTLFSDSPNFKHV
jgi:hypothetical protein